MTAIILAAGVGKRANLKENKVLVNYQDKPLFMHSVELFKKKGFQVVLVINKDDEKIIKKHYDGLYVYGGKTRSESVYEGLKKVNSKYVFIHDAARPFLSEGLVDQLIENLNHYDALFVGSEVNDTVYDKELNLLKREELVFAETPQVFLTKKILTAYQKRTKEYSDDISLYKDFYNDEVKVIIHNINNAKITTNKDLKLLNDYYKIGHAYDIHVTKKGNYIMLGGVKISSSYGVLAHSDGDVLLHAISEALLGALGLGDLGTHFPDTDLKYKNLDSSEILKYVKEKLKEQYYQIVNIDASIYAEEPKLNKHIEKIRENISNILKINKNYVNIKAGTNEGIGEIGRKEAIASEAICLIRSGNYENNWIYSRDFWIIK